MHFIYDSFTYNFVLDTEIGTYCGRTKPGVLEVLTSEAMVVFQSSLTNTRLPITKGFRLNYTFNNDGTYKRNTIY